MGKKFEKVKDNKKSEVYENDDYLMKISEMKGYFLKKNGTDYTEYDTELDDDDYKFEQAIKLEITNKKTKKTSQKRCFQGWDEIINDVQNDVNYGKKQFKSLFEKIDN